ncbi:MAG: CPBP family glutamic-type intramembrane protease [Planctomycetota bacterium]|jgi:membrane protease YdiL (CAAX protease family)
MIAGISVNAFIAFGEELGWRGLLHHEWKNMGFWKSSSLIGFVWGIWHAPLVLQGHNYPQHSVIGVFLMIIWCVLISPTFSYIRIRSNSVIAVSILHGTFNGTGIIAIMMLNGGSDLLIGPTGLAGVIVLVLTNIILLCHNMFWAKERIESYI